MTRWRSWVGMLLILLPLLCVVGMIALGVLLDSMGMDIHWKSKAMFIVTVSALVASLAGCVALGVKLGENRWIRNFLVPQERRFRKRTGLRLR